MESHPNSKLNLHIKEFMKILQDARDSGLRVTREFQSHPLDSLQKTDPAFFKAITAIPENLRPEVLAVVDFALKTSFYYLFKRLEEGEAGFSFELTMNDDASGERFSLINQSDDFDFRTQIQAR